MLAGSAGAKRQDDGLIDTSSAGVEVDLPGGEELPDVEGLTECSNRGDDDGDGKLDLDDPECADAARRLRGRARAAAARATSPRSTAAARIRPDDGGDDPGSGGNGGRGGGHGGGNGDGNGGDNGGNGGGDNGGGQHTPDQPEAHGRPQPRRLPRPRPTRRSRSPTSARPRSASPTSSSTSSRSRRSCSRSTRPAAPSTGSPGRCSPRSTGSRPPSAPTSTSPPPARSGWMQFMPSTWEAYGVDANDDGRKDPYNPVDAICAAARYLNAAGGEEDLRTAIFAYNHADWYVDEVLLYANQYGKLPDDLVGSLTGLTEGAHFPVAADSRYADDISEREAAAQRSKTGRKALGNAADVVSSSPTRRGINIYSREGAPVVAVNDGVIQKIGQTKKLGQYIVLQDAYGNRYTYAELGSVSEVYPVPKQRELTEPRTSRSARATRPSPTSAASRTAADASDDGSEPRARQRRAARPPSPVNTEDMRERLYAFPSAPRTSAGPTSPASSTRCSPTASPATRASSPTSAASSSSTARRWRCGRCARAPRSSAAPCSAASAGSDERRPAPQLRDPARRPRRPEDRPEADPRRLEAARGDGDLPRRRQEPVRRLRRHRRPDPADVEGAARAAACSPTRASRSTPAAARTSQTGQIDRRLLAMLEYLAERGYRLTITSLKCGHSVLTASGNVSHHSSGNAVDIALVNGLPILGNQGPGSITEALVRDVLELQGTMAPEPGHLADGLRRAQLRDGRPRRPRPRRLRAAELGRRRSQRRVRRRSSSPTSGSA